MNKSIFKNKICLYCTNKKQCDFKNIVTNYDKDLKLTKINCNNYQRGEFYERQKN